MKKNIKYVALLSLLLTAGAATSSAYAATQAPSYTAKENINKEGRRVIKTTRSVALKRRAKDTGLTDNADKQIGQDYTYDIDGYVNSLTPKNKATKTFTFSDPLEKVLNYKSVKVFDKDAGNTDITAQGKTTYDAKTNKVTWTANNVKTLYNHSLKFKVTVSIKPDADLTPYMSSGKVSITNMAAFIYNDTDEDDSNVPHVTPNEQDNKIVKKIESGSTLVDSSKEQVGKDYTYAVTGLVQNITADKKAVTSFTFKDSLEKVLTYKSLKVYDTNDSNKDITAEGTTAHDAKTNVVTWKAKDVKSLYNHKLAFKLVVKIDPSADLSDYVGKDDTINIPNKASFIFNDDDHGSNVPEVTPLRPDHVLTKMIEK